MASKQFNSVDGYSVANATIVIDANSNVSANAITGSTLSVTGTSNLNSVGNVTILGGTTGQVLTTNGSGLLSWSTVTAGATTSIANGTSNVNIATANGNVTTSVGGTSNVLVVSNTGANIAGTLNATGNVTAGNLTVSGVASITSTTAGIKLEINSGSAAQSLIRVIGATSTDVRFGVNNSNGFFGTISNTVMAIGTNSFTRMTIDTNGNVGIANASPQHTLSVTGNTFLGSNSNVTITGGTTGQVLTTNGSGSLSWSTVTAGAATSIANGTSNVNIATANGNVTVGVGGTGNIVIVTTTGVNVAGTLNTGTGNANVGNIGAATAIFTTGNITTINSSLLQNSTSNVAIAAGANVTVGVAGNTRITATTTGANVTGTLGVSGNVTAGNISTSALVANGNVNVNQNAADIFTIAALQPPTTDMVVITNAGQNVATAGVSAMQINYTGGTGAIEASAIRSDMTPGTTSGSTWNAFRVAATAAAVTGVTFNGIKFDNKTAGAGTSRAFYVGTGYDEILNYNGTAVINGNGTVNASQLTGSQTTLDVTGTSNLNTVSNVTILGGTNGQVLTTNGTGGLSWTTVSGGGGGGASIANGTSNVNIAAANGNITAGVGGTANVITITSTGLNIGSGTGGNITNANVISANTFIGDGSQLTGLLGKTMMVSTQYLSV